MESGLVSPTRGVAAPGLSSPAVYAARCSNRYCRVPQGRDQRREGGADCAKAGFPEAPLRSSSATATTLTGHWVYEVEVRAPDRTEFEITIDAASGKLLSKVRER